MQQETFSNKEHSLQIQESVNGKDVYIVQTGRGGPQVDFTEDVTRDLVEGNR